MSFQKTILLLIFASILISCKITNTDTLIKKQKHEIKESEFPKRIGFVNDFENIYTKKEIDFIENSLIYYKKTSNREIVIITLDTLPKNTNFKQYTTLIADKWNVGKNNNGNGLTVLLSKSSRFIRISTTEKTRYYLSDQFCKKVIEENMIPKFKKENYYEGLLLGLSELMKKWL